MRDKRTGERDAPYPKQIASDALEQSGPWFPKKAEALRKQAQLAPQ